MLPCDVYPFDLGTPVARLWIDDAVADPIPAVSPRPVDSDGSHSFGSPRTDSMDPPPILFPLLHKLLEGEPNKG